MGEYAKIHVNAGKNLRGYKRKHPYLRKVPKAAVFPQNIQNPIYTPKNIQTPNTQNILEYKQAKSMADTMGFAFAAFFSGEVIISPSPPNMNSL